MTDFQKELKKLYGSVQDEVRQRIADGIEKNRKRSAELHFSSPDGKPENIVHFECDKDFTGSFINVKITRADTFALYGEKI